MKAIAVRSSSVLALLAATWATAALRKSVDVAKVDLKSECISVSDPSDIHLFFHEDIVNSFLMVKDRFGRGRIQEMHFNHDHLALHGGTVDVPCDWSDGKNSYHLADWGMVGGIEDAKDLRVYYLKEVEFVRKEEAKAAPPSKFPPVPKRVMVKKDGGRARSDLSPGLDDRAADAFERYAVEELAKGEKLIQWDRPEFVRFVGPIRAATSCLKCHSEAKEGDLLGAFAYDYAKGPPKPVSEERKKILTAARQGKTIDELERLYQPTWAYTTRMILAGSGVVTQEMVDGQKEGRAWVLRGAVQLEREGIQAKATPPVRLH